MIIIEFWSKSDFNSHIIFNMTQIGRLELLSNHNYFSIILLMSVQIKDKNASSWKAQVSKVFLKQLESMPFMYVGLSEKNKDAFWYIRMIII